MSKRGPILIEIDENAPAPSPAEAPPVPDTLPQGAAMQQVAALAGRPRGGGLARWFWSILGALISFAISLAAYDYVMGLIARNPILGGIAAALIGLFVLVLLVIALRELAAFGRLRRIDALQRQVSDAVATGSLKEARASADAVMHFYRDRPEARQASDELEHLNAEVMDGDTILATTETALITPLDQRALAEIEAASRQVALVTAVVPLALADVVAALTSNLRMIRRIAEIYGGRAGTLGSWRLTRTVFGHLVATGAVAVGDDLIGSVAGGGALAKVSRRFGEGVINGALTARVGIAALEVCRPMPYLRAKPPTVSGIIGRSLKGLF